VIAARRGDDAAAIGLALQESLEVHRGAARLERADRRVILVLEPHFRAERGRHLRPHVLRRGRHDRREEFAAASMAARSGSGGAGGSGADASVFIGFTAFMTRKYTRHVQYSYSTVAFPNHSTGPLLYMALQTKQDHRLPAQLAARLAQRIETHALRPGTRLPSIRNCAEESRVSRSTVVEAYDRLIAAGLIESRRGSGFYGARARKQTCAAPRRAEHAAGTVLDVSWLLRAQRRQSPGSEQPGAGLLPEDWLDHEMVAAAVRGVGRSRGSWLLKYGAVEGYLPLREALSTRLGQAGIAVSPEQIVTSAGATEAIDLVARRYLAPGDVVFVEDPAWFVMFARFAAFGARIVGVPRGVDGPDIAALESLLARERPKLFIMNSVAHNPTGSCMSAPVAARVLELAHRHDFMILEDDIYGDLPGPSWPCAREHR
jgi:DNA-binding transcriptional regulator YhcF (GntR family)